MFFSEFILNWNSQNSSLFCPLLFLGMTWQHQYQALWNCSSIIPTLSERKIYYLLKSVFLHPECNTSSSYLVLTHTTPTKSFRQHCSFKNVLSAVAASCAPHPQTTEPCAVVQPLHVHGLLPPQLPVREKALHNLCLGLSGCPFPYLL